MTSSLLRAYHRLPSPLQSVAASLWGFYLRSWRYGRDTERLVEEALEREHWSGEQWCKWREERLAFVLHRAATRVPYYRQRWEARRRRGDRASWEVLENWSILEKDQLRATPLAFLADDCQPSTMYEEHTSGTTGTPLRLWWSLATVRRWYALWEARWRRWYGVSRRDRWAMIGGQLVVPTARRRPPYWIWNAGLNQLYISSYHLAPDRMVACLEALRRYRVKHLLGYTSALHALAVHARTVGWDPGDLSITVAVTNAEPVQEHQRSTIRAAFRCRVQETYGMAEIVGAAGECAGGTLHLWPEVGHVEVMDRSHAAPAQEAGDLVCTGLLNADMPLVRYRVGDRGALAPPSECECGRKLPALAFVEGRTDDVLHTSDGRVVGRLGPVFRDLPIHEAQIEQDALDHVTIRYVPAAGCTARDVHPMVERLQARMGSVHVALEAVERIPRTTSGKFRSIICNLASHARPQKVP